MIKKSRVRITYRYDEMPVTKKKHQENQAHKVTSNGDHLATVSPSLNTRIEIGDTKSKKSDDIEFIDAQRPGHYYFLYFWEQHKKYH